MMKCHYIMTCHPEGSKSVNSHCCYTDLNTSFGIAGKRTCIHTLFLYYITSTTGEWTLSQEIRHKYVAEVSFS